MFYTPNSDTGIGPIEDLINEGHPPMYQKIQNNSYKELMDKLYKQQRVRRRVEEAFELQQ